VLKEGTVAMFGERIEVLQALSKNNGNSGQQAPRIEG
jgi:ATP-binding cassette subfamily C protein